MSLRALQVALLCSILQLAAGSAHAELRGAGDVVGTTTTGRGIEFRLTSGGIGRVEFRRTDVVRVRIAPSGRFDANGTAALIDSEPLAVAPTIYDTASVTYLVSVDAVVAVSKQPFGVIVWRSNGSLVQSELSGGTRWDTATGMVMTQKFALPDEHYFGFGERGGPIDRRGRRFFMYNTDRAGYDEFADPLYITIPFYWGLRGGDAYGVYFDNPAFPFFNADPDKDGIFTFGALAGELDYYVMSGPTPADVARQYASLTGRPQLPPLWTLGFHQSRYGYASQAEILNVASTLRAERFPADVLYFDIDYLDRLQTFSWNPSTFPNPHAMNAALDAQGFKRVNIIEPIVRTDDRLWDLLAWSGHFVRAPDGAPLVNTIWYGLVSWLDFTQPAAATWFGDMVKAFISTGITALWLDLNEPAQNFMPEAVYLGMGNSVNAPEARSDLQIRNLYALLEAKTAYQALAEARPGMRPWLFSRSGFAGMQRYSSNWGGDALSTFDSLRVSVAMSQSMALSGQNQFGHDIGGFLDSPSAELFVRWMEFAAYTPLFRNHAMNTSLPREPWVFGEPYSTMVRGIIEEHYRLLPYLYSLMAHASASGSPALSPLMFHFPKDERTYTSDTDFMLGPSLLVAPVVAEGATTRTVYLPAGTEWFNAAAADQRLPGGTVQTVDAPLDRTPLFIRAGAVIPKGPVVQHTGERPLTDPRVHLYSGPETTFLMYEDDGLTFDYQNGVHLWTALTRRDVDEGAEVEARRVGGTWTPPEGRRWWFEFHGLAGLPREVLANGVALPRVASEAVLAASTAGWTLTSAGRVVVMTPDSVNPVVVRVVRVP